MITRELLAIMFGPSTLASTLRLATPLVLAALGGAFTAHADIFNIALDGYMLIAAFFGAWGAIVFGNPWAGLACAILAATLCSTLFAGLVLKLRAHPAVVGLGMNLGITGLSTWLLQVTFHVRGWVVIEKGGFSNVHLPVIASVPFLGDILSNQNFMVYLAFILAIVTERFLKHNVYGIRLRAVGENPEAAQSVGIDPLKYKVWSVLMSGVLCGCAGAFLSLGGSSMFSEGMSSGKGALALGIVVFASGRPLLIVLGSLVFGYTDAVSVALQQFGLPNQLMMMIPYVMIIVVLAVVAALSKRPLHKRVPQLGRLLRNRQEIQSC
jgi:ABC-type uncharacterized transport system permease subunit